MKEGDEEKRTQSEKNIIVVVSRLNKAYAKMALKRMAENSSNEKIRSRNNFIEMKKQSNEIAA